MAICNLFKTITKDTGNFMMFSQYTEDLTKSSTTPGYYRVVPSKFIAINANYNKEALKKYAFSAGDLNKGLPLFIQNDFENGCALMRGKLEEAQPDIKIDIENSTKYNHWTSNMFWNALLHNNIISMENDVMYYGDINILSYDEYDGMGYSEIYCFIPNDAMRQNFHATRIPESMDRIIQSTKDYVEGYDLHSPIPADWTAMLKDKSANSPQYNYGRRFTFEFEDDGEINVKDPKIKIDKFDFNTIIILYEVRVKNEKGEIETYKSDIPMGMYITGTINEDGSVNNAHTKYTSNADIYDSGTSYGLRICSRFTVTPENDTIQTVDINTEQDGYSAYCQVMTEFAKSQSKMDNILDQLHVKDLKYNELYGIFKNSRTNVPYIKEIGGIRYWFVNGRLVCNVDATSGMESLSENEIDELCPIEIC